MLAGLAAQALPALGGFAANAAGSFLQNKMGAMGGQTNVGSAQPAMDTINSYTVDPAAIAAAQEAAARSNAQYSQGMGQSNTLFGAGLGNQVANMNNQRAAALNAQANAAQLAGAQMSNAAQRAAANAGMIQGAINSGLGLAR